MKTLSLTGDEFAAIVYPEVVRQIPGESDAAWAVGIGLMQKLARAVALEPLTDEEFALLEQCVQEVRPRVSLLASADYEALLAKIRQAKES